MSIPFKFLQRLVRAFTKGRLIPTIIPFRWLKAMANLITNLVN